MNTHAHDASVTDLQRTQVIRLVTRSFVNELSRYGMARSELVSISTELLGHAMNTVPASSRAGSPSDLLAKLEAAWEDTRSLVLEGVRLRELAHRDISDIAGWLSDPKIAGAFFTPFPSHDDALAEELLDEGSSRFCAIEMDGKLVGLIGGRLATGVDSRIEMRKLIGEASMRGKGVGKRATLMWLYLMFEICEVHKIFLHSLDTNIRNINLNSSFGFELEGILRQEHHTGDGFADVLRMGLTRDHWRAHIAQQSIMTTKEHG